MAAYDDSEPYYPTNNSNQSSQAYDDDSAPTQKYIKSKHVATKSNSGIFATNTIKEGWVLKKGPQSFAGWKKRYIQLGINKQLSYYTDESMVDRKGNIFLEGLTIHHIKRSSKTSDSKHHGFCVVTNSRTYQFCVQSSSDRDHWIQKIRETVDESWSVHKTASISYSGTRSDQQNSPMSNKYHYDNAYGNGNTNIHKKQQFKSKYNRKPTPSQQQQMNNAPKRITEQEAKQQIQELEQKNDDLLDEALRTTYQTTDIAADTAQKLDSQRNQLLNIDKNLHETNEMLDKTEGILDGMKSWGGMIKRKFKKNKDPLPNAYQAPVPKESAVKRNNKYRNSNDDDNYNQSNGQKQLSQYDADNVQDAKLDELLKGVRALNHMGQGINQELEEQDVILDNINEKMDHTAPRMQQQVRTMKKITGK